MFFEKCGSQQSFCTKEAHDEYEQLSLKLAEVVEMQFRNPQEVWKAQQPSKLWKSQIFWTLIFGVTCYLPVKNQHVKLNVAQNPQIKSSFSGYKNP